MLDLTKIHEAIDEFTLQQGPETYLVDIPAQKERGYLGMSAIGHECRRATWYEFRKVAKKQFPARMLRLFRRGDIQEYMFMHLLRGIGFEIFEKDENGKQFKATDFEGHFSGSMDGVAKAPKKFWFPKSKPHAFLLEFKTVNDAGFKKYLKESVKTANPRYWAQLHAYMGYNDLPAALFCVVNKNDDHIHFEWVPFDKFVFRRIVASAEDILTATSPPEKISNNPAWWQCKFCNFYDNCHKGKPSVKSCRSCRWASPGLNKSWICEKGQPFGTLCKQYKDIAR